MALQLAPFLGGGMGIGEYIGDAFDDDYGMRLAAINQAYNLGYLSGANAAHLLQMLAYGGGGWRRGRRGRRGRFNYGVTYDFAHPGMMMGGLGMGGLGMGMGMGMGGLGMGGMGMGALGGTGLFGGLDAAVLGSQHLLMPRLYL